MNSMQLDTLIRQHTNFEETAAKIPNFIDTSLISTNYNDLDNVICIPTIKLLQQSGSYRLISDTPNNNCVQKDLVTSNVKNIFFGKHPRFLKITEHSHNFIEMIFVYSGQCHQIINGKKVSLNEGDICILDTNVKHSIEAAGENDIIINCVIKTSYFDYTFLGQLSENDILSKFFIRSIYQSKKFNEYIIFSSHEESKIKEIIINLLCEYYDKALCSSEVINCYMIILFAELLRSHKDKINEQNYYSLKNVKISDIILYIENNYKTVTLESVAKYFYFNPSYLSSAIKKITGKNFLNILHEIKIKNAYMLLKNSDLSISEIANEVGYSNMSFFYQIFKKKYGITPAKFRNEINHIVKK